jgi:hypothetical protein
MGWSCSGWPDEDVAARVIVMVEVPEGVTTGGGAERGGMAALLLPPPQPAALTNAQKRAALRTPQDAKRFLPEADSNGRNAKKEIRRSSANATSGRSGRSGTLELGSKRTGCEGGKMPEPLVVTVTFNGVGAPLARDRVAGT